MNNNSRHLLESTALDDGESKREIMNVFVGAPRGSMCERPISPVTDHPECGVLMNPILAPHGKAEAFPGLSKSESACFLDAQEIGAPRTGGAVVPRVAVVDDEEDLHLFFQDLREWGRFRLARPCYTAARALERLPKERPDVVIMDLRLPDMSGIDCLSKLKTILPELRIILLTGYPDRRTFFRSIMEGAMGFLVKPVSASEFLEALDQVLQGEYALARHAVQFLAQLVRQIGQITQDSRLTRREEEILACLFEGMQDKEIAATLGIGTATVHTHIHWLFEKLGVHSRRDIIAKYLTLDAAHDE